MKSKSLNYADNHIFQTDPNLNKNESASILTSKDQIMFDYIFPFTLFQ